MNTNQIAGASEFIDKYTDGRIDDIHTMLKDMGKQITEMNKVINLLTGKVFDLEQDITSLKAWRNENDI